jgi:hypothetical protein
MSETLCRSCGAPIRWALTVKGHRMPLDAMPVVDGNILLDVATDPPTARVLPASSDLNEGDSRGLFDRYKSHFATCPNAAQHRKRSRA